jgi:hypothetical protein
VLQREGVIDVDLVVVALGTGVGCSKHMTTCAEFNLRRILYGYLSIDPEFIM